MSKVKIVFPAVLTEITKEKAVELSASTLGEALEKVADHYGDRLREKIFDSEGRPRRLLTFFINGKNARLLRGLDTPLSDGDEILILPAVSGG
jgi:MoaD family protein